jgi:hypothetical protein
LAAHSIVLFLAALGALQAACFGLARALGMRLEIRAAALAVLLPLALLAPWLFGGEVLAPTGVMERVLPGLPIPDAAHRGHLVLNDPLYQFLPWELEVRHALRARRLPLWSDTLDGGSSPWLNPQAGALSPLAMLARPLPIQHFLAATLAFKMLLAFEGVWLLVRRLGRSRVAALVAAVSFTLGGGLMAWALFPHTATVAWVPWLALGCVETCRRPRPAAIAATGLITAALLLSGHPETALAGGLFAALVGLWLGRRPRLLQETGRRQETQGAPGMQGGPGVPEMPGVPEAPEAREELRGGRGRPRPAGLGRGVAAAALAAALGCGLAAPQILPFLRAVPDSQRARDMTAATMPPHELRLLAPSSWFLPLSVAFLRSPVNPLVFGVPYGKDGPVDWPNPLSGYAGLAAFAGALVALFAARAGPARPFLAFAILALLLTAGFLPFAMLTYAVPALRLPAYPRLLPVASLALAVAASFGCDLLLRAGSRRLQVAAALALAAALSLAAAPAPAVVALWALLLAAAAVAAVAARRRHRWQRWRDGGAALLVAALALDLVPWSLRLLPHGQGGLFYPPNALTARLAAETAGGAWRTVGVSKLVYPSLLPVYGLSDIRPNNVMAPSAYLGVLAAAFSFTPSAANYYSAFCCPYHPLLSFLNVRAVVSNIYQPPLLPRTLVPLDAPEILPFLILRNTAALPRWFVPAAIEPIDRAAVGPWVARMTDPRRVAVFRDEIGAWRPTPPISPTPPTQPIPLTPPTQPIPPSPPTVPAGAADGGVAAARQLGGGAPGHLRLAVPGRGDRLLATSLTLPAGWAASAAGRRLPTLTVNGAFLGVRVPAATTQIDLDFTPPGFRAGVALGAAALGLLVGLSLAVVRRRFGGRSRPAASL